MAGLPLVADKESAGGELAFAGGKPAGGAPCFLIHDETCSAEQVRALAGHLAGAATVFALPVVEPESTLRTVEGIALHLARRILAVQPEGSYRIAGWALGGIVAYEVAGLLLGRDKPVEFLGFVDPRGHAPQADGAADAPNLSDLVRRYVPPPLPVTVHLFTAGAASDASPWKAFGAAEPKAAIRRIPIAASASPADVPEVGALAQALAGELRRAGEPKKIREEEHSSLFPLRFKGRGAPVFCIPGAGASVVGLAELAENLDPGSPVFGLEPRGMDGSSIPHTAVEAAAGSYLAEIGNVAGAGPIHLIGHSFGGWVAFEMALRLRAAGRPVASLSLIDSEVPHPDASIIRECDAEEAFLSLLEVLELSAERSFEIRPEEVHALDPEARLRLLHGRMVRFGMVPARSAPAMLAGPFRVFSACLRATYRPSAAYPGPARLVLLRDPRLDFQADQLQGVEVVRGWRAWLPDVQATVGPGNHMTALKPPHVEQLASLLPLNA
jgi:thioesterase domain-containing protein